MPRNQKVKPQGFEDGAENDLKNKTKQNKKTTNLKSTKPQLEYFDPLNNTVRKTESLKQKATSQNCKQYTTKRNNPPPQIPPLTQLAGCKHTTGSARSFDFQAWGRSRVLTLDCEVRNQVQTLFLRNPSPTLKSFLLESHGF